MRFFLKKKSMETQKWTMFWKSCIHFKLFANLKTEMKCIHSLNITMYYNKEGNPSSLLSTEGIEFII